MIKLKPKFYSPSWCGLYVGSICVGYGMSRPNYRKGKWTFRFHDGDTFFSKEHAIQKALEEYWNRGEGDEG